MVPRHMERSRLHYRANDDNSIDEYCGYIVFLRGADIGDIIIRSG